MKLININNNISLIVYDFDGVMTDNRAIVFQDGTEAVIVNRADGLGVDYLRREGIPQMILSTESNPVVNAITNDFSVLDSFYVNRGNNMGFVIMNLFSNKYQVI